MHSFDQLIHNANLGKASTEPLLAGNSVAAHALRQIVALASGSIVPVMLIGQDTVFNRSIANAVHRQSAYPDDPFIEADCKRMDRDHFSIQWEGTLYLDDITIVDVHSQLALFDWMNREESQNVRIIAASANSLRTLGAEDQLIKPLIQTFSSLVIPSPALADRTEDIPDILHQLWQEYPKQIEAAALEKLKEHKWPAGYAELLAFAEKLLHLDGLGSLSGELVTSLLKSGTDEPVSRPHINLKQHLAEEEKLFLTGALLRSQGIVPKAAEIAGLKQTTFVAKMRKYGLA
jgi:two-component system, NtrC family, nitrogen regulation response regulator GlnG